MPDMNSVRLLFVSARLNRSNAELSRCSFRYVISDEATTYYVDVAREFVVVYVQLKASAHFPNFREEEVTRMAFSNFSSIHSMPA